jgi:hypothetical protein
MRVSGVLSRPWSHLDVFICLQTSTVVIVPLPDLLEKAWSERGAAHDAERRPGRLGWV